MSALSKSAPPSLFPSKNVTPQNIEGYLGETSSIVGGFSPKYFETVHTGDLTIPSTSREASPSQRPSLYVHLERSHDQSAREVSLTGYSQRNPEGREIRRYRLNPIQEGMMERQGEKIPVQGYDFFSFTIQHALQDKETHEVFLTPEKETYSFSIPSNAARTEVQIFMDGGNARFRPNTRV